MPDKTVGVILGGGVGTRLFPLTRERSKPAVPFGGKYRLVDVPISNCLNGGIRRVFVLTQFNSASLNNHVTHTCRFDASRKELRRHSRRCANARARVVVSGHDHCRVERSVVGIRSRIQKGATLSEALVMGADYYQFPDAIQADIDAGIPPIGIGEGAIEERAIVDKNVRIGTDVKIVKESVDGPTLRRVWRAGPLIYVRFVGSQERVG